MFLLVGGDLVGVGEWGQGQGGMRKFWSVEAMGWSIGVMEKKGGHLEIKNLGQLKLGIWGLIRNTNKGICLKLFASQS